MTIYRISARRTPLFTDRSAALPLAAVWAFTRAGMLLLLWRDNLGIGGIGREVYLLYRHWYQQLSQGTFPPGDVTWQYPPGAGLVFLAPGHVPELTYYRAFVALTLLADAVVTFALARAGTSGAWLWVVGLPLLLHLPLARYDVQVTATAVLGLLALRGGHARLGGALAGLGAMIKVWPLLTLLGTPAATSRAGRGRPRWWRGRAVRVPRARVHAHPGLRAPAGRPGRADRVGRRHRAVAGAAGGLVAGPGPVPVRGLRAGRAVRLQRGPLRAGPHRARLLLAAAVAGAVVAVGAATPVDAALTAVLLFTVTSRVISPSTWCGCWASARSA